MTYYQDGFFIYAEADRQRNRAEGRNSHGSANFTLEPVAKVMARSNESSEALLARGRLLCEALNQQEQAA